MPFKRTEYAVVKSISIVKVYQDPAHAFRAFLVRGVDTKNPSMEECIREAQLQTTGPVSNAYRFECLSCLLPVGNFMVRHEVWKEAGLGAGVICLRCLEGHLGRPLRIEDFTECANNEPIRFAYAMGLHRATVSTTATQPTTHEVG